MDPTISIFLILLGMYVYIFRSRLLNLFSKGIKPHKSVFESDYLHLIVITLLSYYPIYALVSLVFPSDLVQIDVFGLTTLFFTVPTVICGIVYTALLSPVWYRTVESEVAPILGMLVAVMFGAFFSTYLAVGFGLDTPFIRQVFGGYVDMALDILRMITLMAILPVIQRFIEHAYTILKNNFFVALRGALFAAVGGIVGAGTLLSIIPLFATSTVAGIFAGLLLRNNIELIYASFLSLLAVLGVPPFWHTFYEFTAFSLIAASIGVLVHSFISRKETEFKYSASGVVVGSLLLMFGAFNEVTVSASIAGVFRNYLSFEPVISNITFGGSYLASFITAWLFVLAVAVVVAYSIELIVRIVEEVSV